MNETLKMRYVDAQSYVAIITREKLKTNWNLNKLLMIRFWSGIISH